MNIPRKRSSVETLIKLFSDFKYIVWSFNQANGFVKLNYFTQQTKRICIFITYHELAINYYVKYFERINVISCF